MIQVMPTDFDAPKLVDYPSVSPQSYTQQQASEANHAFDQAVRQFLHQWIEQGTAADTEHAYEGNLQDFVQQGALRSFFKHHDDALERLLSHDTLARHLLRPANEVYFEPDAYEPLLATFERRIYNLAAHREHREVPFRYSSPNRQGAYGDSIGLSDLPPEQAREDIGYYFGTRRSDNTALNLLARQLRFEARFATVLPTHVLNEGYMAESLRMVRLQTEQQQAEEDTELHCYVIHRRHAIDDRHLGLATVLMNPQQPHRPQRVIFHDTLRPNGRAPWWNTFRRCLDSVFPQPEGEPPASDFLEDGGVNLQRLHDGVPIRHQDIDCAFYTAAMGRAMVQLAKQSPELITSGPIEQLVSQMTERMTDYFDGPNQPQHPDTIRFTNIVRRWETGRAALDDIRQQYLLTHTEVPLPPGGPDALNWAAPDSLGQNPDVSVAA